LTPPSVPAGAEIMRAEAMAAYTRSMLEPLVQTIERQAETIAELREERGRQSAELERAASIAVKLSDDLDAARAQISTLAARTEAQSIEPPLGSPYDRLRSWVPWLLIAAILLVAFAVGLPAWVR
jgi:hypothetical protein